MKYLKKYPIFFVVVAVLLVAFVGILGFDAYLQTKSASLSKALNREMNAYRTALADDPTQVAIDASKANIEKLESHLAFLEKDLTRASKDIFIKLTAKEGFQLVEQLRGFVNSWRKEARKLDIRVDDKMDFGFKKYVAPNAEPPREEAVADIWKQACVLNYINKKLFACKSAESPMGIFAVQREILPSEGASTAKKRQRFVRARRGAEENMGDNFKIDDAITARKAGSLDTLAYRFVFAGHTDVLRRFLNQLKDFDAMLVVRSIEVKPADMSNWDRIANSESNDVFGQGADSSQLDTASIFGASATENTENKEGESEQNAENTESQQANITPVVVDNISEFTVIIEYVEVVKSPKDKKDGDKK